jgi:ADP-ribose pyrophosphatase
VSDGGPSDPFVDPAAEAELREVTVDTRVLHRGRTMTFRIDTIERADGSRHGREIVGHPGAVAVVALDADDRLLLVRQYRTAAGAALLEIPAGTLDVDPVSGAIEDPDLAAPRELEEETGVRASAWRKLGSFWTAPGFATELMHLYLALDLRPAHGDRLGPDEDEELQVVRVPFGEALAAVDAGRIVDAKSIVGILRVARLQGRG